MSVKPLRYWLGRLCAKNEFHGFRLYVEKVIVHEDEVEVILNLVPFFYRKNFTEQVHVISRKSLSEGKGV